MWTLTWLVSVRRPCHRAFWWCLAAAVTCVCLGELLGPCCSLTRSCLCQSTVVYSRSQRKEKARLRPPLAQDRLRLHLHASQVPRLPLALRGSPPIRTLRLGIALDHSPTSLLCSRTKCLYGRACDGLWLRRVKQRQQQQLRQVPVQRGRGEPRSSQSQCISY